VFFEFGLQEDGPGLDFRFSLRQNSRRVFRLAACPPDSAMILAWMDVGIFRQKAFSKTRRTTAISSTVRGGSPKNVVLLNGDI
jgi:hypothetical protein